MLITSVFQRWAKSVAALACVALLAACGGGGGKSSTANSVASLSSASSLSISSSLSSAANVVGGAIQGVPLNIAGVVTTLAGTAGGTDGIALAATFHNPAGVVSDGTNLYVADTINNKIRKIVIATGVVTTLAGSGSIGNTDGIGTAASFYHPEGITSDGANLYVADTYNNKIRKIVLATGEVTTFAGDGYGSNDGIGTAAKFSQPYGITSDGISLYVADTYGHKIRKIVIATRAVTTLAGNDYSSFSYDGIGTSSGFVYPRGITSDGTNLYVVEDTQIRKIVIATGVVTTLAGSSQYGSAGGIVAYGNDDGIGAEAKFYYAQGVTNDGTNLYVTELNKIRKIVIATGAVTTLAGSLVYGNSDGTGTEARFCMPSGITNYGANLYAADGCNHKIRKIVTATGAVTTLAGNTSYDSANGREASFYYPSGITSDGSNLYVADNGNNKIRKIVIGTGAVTTLAGSDSKGGKDGTGAAASFDYPTGITSDGTNLYVADTHNHKIRKIVIATGAVTTLAGSTPWGDADGTGTASSFNNPEGITSDGTNLYVADTINNKIRKIVIASGVVTTFAGRSLVGSADDIGTAASFAYPRGITSDGSNLYVADTVNNKIRKIVIATGVVTTLAGSGSQGSADGTGAAASFNNPVGITSDGTNLYVADEGNNEIRKIVIATGVVTTLAGGTQGSADGIGTTANFIAPYGITSDGFELFVTDTSNNTIRKIH